MEKEEKVNKSNKKLFAIIAAAVVLVAGIIILIVCLNKGTKSNEEKLKQNMEKLGVQFYEEFYYPAQEKSQKDVKAFIAKFEKTGIRVNLFNLSKLSVVDKKIIEDMVNSKTNEKCDQENTYVVIKPIKPYGKKDHEIEVVLACGDFGKKSKKEDAKKTETKKVDTKKTETKKEETKKTADTKNTEAKKTETKKK